MSSEIVVPDLGESIFEATVGRWLKKEGERVSVGDPVVELETDKVDLEVGAERDGVLASIRRQEGEDVQVGDVLAVLEEVEAAEAPPEPEAQAEAEPEPEAEPERAEDVAEAERRSEPEPSRRAEAGRAEQPGPDGARPDDEERATPVALRLARQHEVDLGQVEATGRGGRIVRADVERFLEAEGKPEPQEAPAAKAVAPHRAEERVRMSRRRRTIARRLVEAQRSAAMLTTFNDADMSQVMDLRQRRRDEFRQRHGVGLGITSFFVKASIGALRDFPRLNAEIDGDEIVLKRYYDIGIAIGAEQGLVVPVLRNADRMSFAEIESEIERFVDAAQDGSLTLEDLRGGTFTITNGGVFGSLLSTPILNPPQAAILGLHRIEARPVAVDGDVVVRPMMYLALSYDHRIVDGREAVQFLGRIKALVEDPVSLMLDT